MSRAALVAAVLDGILCAYLAYYYWYWGEEGCWVVGDTSTGYITLPRCRLKNCEIAAKNLITFPDDTTLI
jgi:predicted RNase H-like nuclease